MALFAEPVGDLWRAEKRPSGVLLVDQSHQQQILLADPGGIAELKIDFGPGYRVYYTEQGGELIILLAGGDKSTQQQDIRTAITLAQNL